MTAGTDELTLERSDGVAILTLRAPRRRNALTLEMARAMVVACDEIDADQSIGAVVVAGEGSYFCSGADRAVLAAAGAEPAEASNYRDIGLLYEAFARVGRLEPPTVAAIRGGALGAGLNLALATDLRVVATDAVLQSGFLSIGLHPGGGHGALLAHSGGREVAAGLGMFGASLSAARAVEVGLAWRAVPAGELDEIVLAIAATPAKDPELARATARNLRMIVGPPALPWPAALAAERASQMWSMRRRSAAAKIAGGEKDS
jgi:enoyl-CoA hydratase